VLRRRHKTAPRTSGRQHRSSNDTEQSLVARPMLHFARTLNNLAPRKAIMLSLSAGAVTRSPGSTTASGGAWRGTVGGRPGVRIRRRSSTRHIAL